MQLLSLLANSHITTESFVHCSRTINRQPMKFNQEVWAHDFTWMFLEDMLLVVNAPPLHERTASRFMTLWSVYFRAEPSFKCKYWSIKWVYKAQSYVHFRLQMFPLDDTTFVIMHFWHILLCFQVPLIRFRPPGSKTPFSAARARARRSRRWALRGCSLQASISCDMANRSPYNWTHATLWKFDCCPGTSAFKQPLIHMVTKHKNGKLAEWTSSPLHRWPLIRKFISVKSWQEMSYDELGHI